MKVSIITVCFNSVTTIEQTFQSVFSQDYSEVELVVVDGGSTDGTLEIIEKYKEQLGSYISEPDKGIYDAMNKGIGLATGDVIGILNSDDFYASNSIISQVVKKLSEKGIDAVYGDVAIVSPKNVEKIVRYFSSKAFRPEGFAYGYMPAHPTFFTYKKCYTVQGGFKTDYHIAADYELLIRFLVNDKLRAKYMELHMITMRLGGRTSSSLYGYYILNKEVIRACRENGIQTGWFKILKKYINKFRELRNPVPVQSNGDG
ncbi:MAG: glycosyltransferase [Flavobacteriales bacterium]|nr:glycosyltransferase [Flavobacteriales bacterium]